MVLSTLRIGLGFDVHPFTEGRPLVLGGVTVPHPRGLMGHSDADVLLHALIDALLGAAGLGDIGSHFPSSDPGLAGIPSTVLLQKTWERVRDRGWRVINVDATLIAEEPRLSPHVSAMRTTIGAILEIGAEAVNVKAKTADRLGTIGQGEGIAALAVVLLASA
jgi:2-C-methyl-D-erythritol 2,4-cyclodiphosphate synthase